jgi:hypothetical protein
MEIPKACWSCGLRFVCKAANDFLTTKEAGCSVLKVGMPGCLIICQLPEGHGRLVDIDKPFLNVLKTCMGTAKYQATIAERLDMGSVVNVEIIVPAEAERSET